MAWEKWSIYIEEEEKKERDTFCIKNIFISHPSSLIEMRIYKTDTLKEKTFFNNFDSNLYRWIEMSLLNLFYVGPFLQTLPYSSFH